VSETPQAKSLTELAEAAAAAGDCVSAARHLRRLAALQEEELGASHPELANTLNNLAVVSERAGEIDAADAAFRRARAITREAFPPDHPFVATSERNLRDFCAAHGRPLEPVAAAPAPVADGSAASDESARVVESHVGRLVGVMAGVAVALLVFWFVFGRSGERGTLAVSTPSGADAAAVPPPKIDPTPFSPEEAPPAVAPPAAATPPKIDPTPFSDAVVVTAAVCRDFSRAGAWRCTPLRAPAPPGTLVYYTRVKTTSPVTLEHRWYQGDRLTRRVSLRVSANATEGYRTFSRQTVTRERAGDWRVELRDAEGALLDEQRFTVRP
jgi:hypothetical protein